MVVYGKHQKASEHDWTTKSFARNKFDNFARYICILKLPKFKEAELEENDEKESRKRFKPDDSETLFKEKSERELKAQAGLLEEILASADASKFERRDWTARRIDFIIAPIDQLPFAILGWTGSKQFERSIRLYSEREFGWRLTSHGIYDHKKVRNLNSFEFKLVLLKKNLVVKNQVIIAKAEREIFELLNLTYREPKDRNC